MGSDVAAEVVVDGCYKNCTSQSAPWSSEETIKTFAAGKVMGGENRCVHLKLPNTAENGECLQSRVRRVVVETYL